MRLWKILDCPETSTLSQWTSSVLIFVIGVSIVAYCPSTEPLISGSCFFVMQPRLIIDWFLSLSMSCHDSKTATTVRFTLIFRQSYDSELTSVGLRNSLQFVLILRRSRRAIFASFRCSGRDMAHFVLLPVYSSLRFALSGGAVGHTLLHREITAGTHFPSSMYVLKSICSAANHVF